MLGHIQCAMPHQLLQSKGIAATVHQIFLCKSVSVFVNGGSLDSSVIVVSSDCVAQRILCQLPTIHIAEQIILWRTFSDSHVLAQNVCHHRAEGDDLDFAVFVVSVGDTQRRQIYILILNKSDSSRSSATVHEEVDHNPTSELPEVTVLCWPFQ